MEVWGSVSLEVAEGDQWAREMPYWGRVTGCGQVEVGCDQMVDCGHMVMGVWPYVMRVSS